MDYYNNESFSNLKAIENSLKRGSYEQCSFTHCDFANADLSNSLFIDCTFTECNLSNAIVKGCSFQNTIFDSCKMPGLHFDQCKPFAFEVHCKACQLNHSSFYKIKASKSTFMNSSVVSVDFTMSDLSGSRITDCDLMNTTFDKTNLSKADLRGSLNYSIDPELNSIKGAFFSLPDVLGLLNKYSINIES